MLLALIDSVPLTYAGGYESFLFALARAASARGHEIRIITPTKRLATAMGRPAGMRLHARLSEAETRHRTAPATLVAAGPRTARAALREAALVYTKNEPHELLFSVRASADKPLVVGFHSAMERRPGFSGAVRATIYRSRFYRSLLRRARGFHVLRPDQLDLLITRYKARRSDIRVIPNGVDLELFRPQSASTSDSTFRVLFVGRLDTQKGIDLFLEAAVILRRRLGAVVSFSVAGDGPLRRPVAKVAREGTVRYLGHVLNMSSIYGEHHITAVPSRLETFPLVPAESLACGLPVLLSPLGAHEPYRECSATLTLSQLTSEALADAIAESHRMWRHHRSQYTALRIEARDFAVRNLNQHVRLSDLVSFLESLARDT